jgi:hypothetical protein
MALLHALLVVLVDSVATVATYASPLVRLQAAGASWGPNRRENNQPPRRPTASLSLTACISCPDLPNHTGCQAVLLVQVSGHAASTLPGNSSAMASLDG